MDMRLRHRSKARDSMCRCDFRMSQRVAEPFARGDYTTDSTPCFGAASRAIVNHLTNALDSAKSRAHRVRAALSAASTRGARRIAEMRAGAEPTSTSNQ